MRSVHIFLNAVLYGHRPLLCLFAVVANNSNLSYLVYALLRCISEWLETCNTNVVRVVGGKPTWAATVAASKHDM